MTAQEKKLANLLREEVLKLSQNDIQTPVRKMSFGEVEYISKNEQPYISPIMTMNEDEILAFVEEFEVAELATLSVAELNRIGEVLGVEPKILLGEID